MFNPDYSHGHVNNPSQADGMDVPLIRTSHPHPTLSLEGNAVN